MLHPMLPVSEMNEYILTLNLNGYEAQIESATSVTIQMVVKFQLLP